MDTRKVQTVPVNREAAQWDGTREGVTPLLEWLAERVDPEYTSAFRNVMYVEKFSGEGPGRQLTITTLLESDVRAWDWLVVISPGLVEVVSPEDFVQNYEPRRAP